MTNNKQSTLLYLSFLAFGFSLSAIFLLSNLSSIFKFLGASNSLLPLLWLIPPITGCIIQPVIGQISDDTITRYGKRRPFILAFSILAALAFMLMTQVNSLVLIVLLILFIDICINGGIESLRALTADSTKTSIDRSKAFAMQAFFSGIGGSIGASLPYLIDKLLTFLHIKHRITPGSIPLNLQLASLFTAVILLLTLYVCTVHVKERITRNELYLKKKKPTNLLQRFHKFAKDLYVSIRYMPNSFRKIFYINSITWMGIFTFWLYFTVSLTQTIYSSAGAQALNPNENLEILNKATLDSSFYFGIYQYVSMGYAVILYFLSKSEKISSIHALSLLIGGVGLASLSVEYTNQAMIFSFIAIGIMWGSLLVLPYAIAMQMLPKRKLGAYLGIFNISVTAPQVICGLLLPPLYQYFFRGHANQLMLIAGILIVISGILWYRLDHPAKAKQIISDEIGVKESHFENLSK